MHYQRSEAGIVLTREVNALKLEHHYVKKRARIFFSELLEPAHDGVK